MSSPVYKIHCSFKQKFQGLVKLFALKMLKYCNIHSLIQKNRKKNKAIFRLNVDNKIMIIEIIRYFKD